MVTIMMVMIICHSILSTSRPGSTSEHLRDGASGGANAFELFSEDGGDGKNSFVAMLVVVEMMNLFLLDYFQQSWQPSPRGPLLVLQLLLKR